MAIKFFALASFSASATVNNINNTTPAKKVIKEGVINLNEKDLDEKKIRVLKFGPKFAPAFKRQQSCMDIIQATEIIPSKNQYMQKAHEFKNTHLNILRY